jgi:hypothetical protein
MAKNNPLDATLEVLQEHAIAYTVERGGKHYRIKPEGLPPIFCSVSASDHRAVVKAVSFIRRTIRKHLP